MWDVEDIPDQDFLYMRIHYNWMRDGKPMPGFFNVRKGENGMSTDWEKYSTPEQTRQRSKKNPDDNAVIAINVGDVRKIPGQTVCHDPDITVNNQAHTLVIGEKTEAARLLFLQIYRMVLDFPPRTK